MFIYCFGRSHLPGMIDMSNYHNYRYDVFCFHSSADVQASLEAVLREGGHVLRPAHLRRGPQVEERGHGDQPGAVRPQVSPEGSALRDADAERPRGVLRHDRLYQPGGELQ